jgi:hypothetical protein
MQNGTGIFPLAFIFLLFLANCQSKNLVDEDFQFFVKAKNTSGITQNNYIVELEKGVIPSGETEVDFSKLVVYDGETEIPSQYHDEQLLFIIEELKPGAEAHYMLKKGTPGSYTKRTQAELSVKKGGYFENRKYIGGDFENIEYLRVPDEHTDHSFYIRYEGPGWESDLVGYRFYLDWRNATDVFGKKTRGMVLQQVGLDGFDSYHEMQDWGVDVLKVGSSLGIGSLGMYIDDHAVRVDKTDSVTCEVLENGAIQSAIKTNYYGWEIDQNKFDIQSVLSIHAGSRLTHHEIEISGQPDNLCTGIGKDSNAKLYTDQGNAHQLGYLATYGLQSLNNDALGLAVLFASNDYQGFTEDDYSHIVKLNVEDGEVDYYFLAGWEGEIDGIKDEDMFLNYVKETAVKLANPLEINVNK